VREGNAWIAENDGFSAADEFPRDEEIGGIANAAKMLISTA